MSQDDELDSNVSVTQLPSHGGYMSGMPMYAGDKEAYRKKNNVSGKRSSKVEIDDSEQESELTPPTRTGPINLSKISRGSGKHVTRTSPRIQQGFLSPRSSTTREGAPRRADNDVLSVSGTSSSCGVQNRKPVNYDPLNPTVQNR